ncbi:MAG TPA: D-alanyl-D-alanine dipeptidase [Ferruginibacter sp.]|nr:D-alanyl-D-alanine dipeptidase [Ferruginibacter sp.]HMP20511.1 D-alanyl-D-alanine dipeptidase [Ferruginibacter sp.]
MNRFYMLLFFGLLFIKVAAQPIERHSPALKVIRDTAVFKKTVSRDTGKQMTDVKKAVPGIVVDLRYAGVNNFLARPIYPALSTTWLRKKAAAALAKVQARLQAQGLGLKIFDAYRPYTATVQMWQQVQDERYAADPKKGSGHNRGIAVDLTLVDLHTGAELDMGTGFDNFTDTAHHDFTALPLPVLQNRLLLKRVMEDNGFVALPTEWWHYALPDAQRYELLDIPFSYLLQY